MRTVDLVILLKYIDQFQFFTLSMFFIQDMACVA